jgi:hypothetical protein
MGINIIKSLQNSETGINLEEYQKVSDMRIFGMGR